MSDSKRGVSKGEIADAYKRFKGHEFETHVQRFELEDKPTPQEQKENLADLILKQRDKITTLRQQLQQAEALVAELIVFGDTQGELSGDYNWELLKSSVNPQPLILRKQAEAVDASKSLFSRWNGSIITVEHGRVILEQEARRLHHRADELEAEDAGDSND